MARKRDSREQAAGRSLRTHTLNQGTKQRGRTRNGERLLVSKPDPSDMLPTARLHHLNFPKQHYCVQTPKARGGMHFSFKPPRRRWVLQETGLVGVLQVAGTLASFSSLWLPGSEVNSLLPKHGTPPPRGPKQRDHLISDRDLQNCELITCFSYKLILSVVLIAKSSSLIHTVIRCEVCRNRHALAHCDNSPVVLCSVPFYICKYSPPYQLMSLFESAVHCDGAP